MLARAAHIARNIVPELSDRPLYVLPMLEGTPTAPSLCGGAMGFYQPHLSEAMQAYIEATGHWQGPGVAVAVNVAAIERCYPDADDVFRALVGITLHEIAHWLTRPEPDPIPSTMAVASFERGRQQAESAPSPEDSLPDFMLMLLTHGKAFTRVCSHLAYRCGHGGGISIAPHWLVFGSTYPGLDGLGEPSDFADSLGGELDQHLLTPLREVAALESDSFTSLWAKGVRRVAQSHAKAPLENT